MSKPLPEFVLDRSRLRAEMAAFEDLLGPGEEKELSERRDILPFFKAHPNLASLIGNSFLPAFIFPDRLKTEYGVVGKHACDLVIGSMRKEVFCVIEFEDALRGSVFKPGKRGGEPEWAPRLSHGLNQIVDWIYALNSIRDTRLYSEAFGSSLARFSAVLVVGRRGHLDDTMRNRLRFRSATTFHDGKSVYCVTFDDLRDEFRERLEQIL
ncbi:MAG: DUF4263 domain-containing protein [Gemmataceae bacterium]|nr:DUF4263 domain-containing protein [Gemmataceae bacterium]